MHSNVVFLKEGLSDSDSFMFFFSENLNTSGSTAKNGQELGAGEVLFTVINPLLVLFFKRSALVSISDWYQRLCINHVVRTLEKSKIQHIPDDHKCCCILVWRYCTNKKGTREKFRAKLLESISKTCCR